MQMDPKMKQRPVGQARIFLAVKKVKITIAIYKWPYWKSETRCIKDVHQTTELQKCWTKKCPNQKVHSDTNKNVFGVSPITELTWGTNAGQHELIKWPWQRSNSLLNLKGQSHKSDISAKHVALTISRLILSFSIRSSSFLCSLSVLAWYISTALFSFATCVRKKNKQVCTWLFRKDWKIRTMGKSLKQQLPGQSFRAYLWQMKQNQSKISDHVRGS